MCAGKDAANHAFVAAYFSHLEDKDTFVEPLPDDDEMSVDGSVAEDEDEDEDEEGSGVVRTSDLQAQLREVARSGKGKVRFFT